MRINKWHVWVEGPRIKDRPRAARKSVARAVEEHWILVDGDLFDSLEMLAAKRRTTVNRLVDTAINEILDRYGAP
jgi:hypothetical protein